LHEHLPPIPELLLADEPTSNLDSHSARDVIEMLGEVHAAGTTVIVATHDPDLIAMAAVVIELSDGRICFESS
jgi:putative ABC transport system ATP-binding protein